jgi:hypothetical protein
MYFDVLPVAGDWFVLVCVIMLQEINRMHLDVENMERLNDQIQMTYKKDFPRLSYYGARARMILKGIFTNLVLLTLIYLIIYIETNIFNWVFYILTTLLIALKMRSSSSVKSLQ